MHSFYLDAIKSFEGYAPVAQWDYAQFSNGYGTRARYAGEVIDKAEADRRFQGEIAKARAVVENTAPFLDEGTKAALTSLTYNAGTAWTRSGLGDAVRRGDLEQVREIFLQYNKAGGEVLPGLVSRRAAEALWIGNPDAVPGSASPVAAGDSDKLPPVIMASAADKAPDTRAGKLPQSLERLLMDPQPRQTARISEEEPASLRRLSGADILALAALETGKTSGESGLFGSDVSELKRLVDLDKAHESLMAIGKSKPEKGRDRA